jgi:hypothetical protein
VGEVRTPGKYPMTAQMSLIEALRQRARRHRRPSTEVMILRPRDAGSAQALTPDQVDQSSVTRVNLADLQLGRLSQNVTLVEGDTIFVPKADKFFITGQVRTPGAYTYERGLHGAAGDFAGGRIDGEGIEPPDQSHSSRQREEDAAGHRPGGCNPAGRHAGDTSALAVRRLIPADT